MNPLLSSKNRSSYTELQKKFTKHLPICKRQECLNLLYKYPADCQKIGQLHKHNTDFGYKTLAQFNPDLRCPCCRTQYKFERELQFNTPMTPTLAELKKMKSQKLNSYHLGSEVVAFFTTIKILLIYLIIRIICFDIFFLVKNEIFYQKMYSKRELTFQGHLVHQDYLFDSKLSITTKAIIAFYKYDFVAYSLLFTTVLLIIYFWYAHSLQFSIYECIQNSQDYQNRYTILVQNIPLVPVLQGEEDSAFSEKPYEERIKTFFVSYIQTHLLSKIQHQPKACQNTDKFEKKLLEILGLDGARLNFTTIKNDIVRNVIVCYENSGLSRMQREKQLILQHFHEMEDKSMCIQKTKQQIEQLNNYHLNAINSFHGINKFTPKIQYFLGFAFVTFNLQIYRDFIVKQSLANPETFQINGSSLAITVAEKPSVIKWENFVERQHQQIKTRVYSNIILFLVLLLAFCVLGYLQYYKIIPMLQNWLNFPKKYQHRIKTLIISVITSLINLCLSKIIQILAQSQRKISKTETIISLLTKNVITQFINSALIYYIITYITPSSFQFDKIDLKKKIQSLIIFPAIIKLFVDVLNFGYFYKKLQYEIYAKNTFQIEYNKYNERPEFDFASRYAYYLVQILTVSFYASLTPIIIPSLAIILPVKYYVDKLILFKKSAQPPKISFRVTNWIHFMSECSMLSFIIGWCRFCPNQLWTQLVQLVSYACLAVVAIYLVIRFRMQISYQKYVGDTQSTKSHKKCENDLMERFQNYDPWKCYVEKKVENDLVISSTISETMQQQQPQI